MGVACSHSPTRIVIRVLPLVWIEHKLRAKKNDKKTFWKLKSFKMTTYPKMHKYIIYQPLAYLSIHLPSLNKISWLALRFKTEPIPDRLPPDHLGAPAMVSETKGIEGAPPRRVVQMNSGPARLLPSCHDALLTSDISWGNYRNSHPSNNIQDTSFFQTFTPQKHRSAKIDT